MYEMPATCRAPAPLEPEVGIYTETQTLAEGLQVLGEVGLGHRHCTAAAGLDSFVQV